MTILEKRGWRGIFNLSFRRSVLKRKDGTRYLTSSKGIDQQSDYFSMHRSLSIFILLHIVFSKRPLMVGGFLFLFRLLHFGMRAFLLNCPWLIHSLAYSFSDKRQFRVCSPSQEMRRLFITDITCLQWLFYARCSFVGQCLSSIVFRSKLILLRHELAFLLK